MTAVRVGVVGLIGHYDWTCLQQTFAAFKDQKFTPEVDLGTYVSATDGPVCECIKLLFEPIMLNFFDNVDDDGLKELNFAQINNVAVGFEKMGIDDVAVDGIFQCIVARMTHIIGGIGDLKRLIPQTTSKSLRSQLQQQLQMLLSMKDDVLQHLSCNYIRKQPRVIPSADDTIKLFDCIWSRVTDENNVNDDYKGECLVGLIALPNLRKVLIDLNGGEAAYILNKVTDSIVNHWTLIQSKVTHWVEDGVQLVMNNYQTKLGELGDDILSFERKCALLAVTHHTQRGTKLIYDVIKNHEQNPHLQDLLEIFLNFYLIQGRCDADWEKLIMHMVDLSMKYGHKWCWYCTFVQWLYMMYPNDEEKIVNIISGHNSQTTMDQFHRIIQLTKFYTFVRKQKPPPTVGKVINSQISWLC